jgi:hypothetical protein
MCPANTPIVTRLMFRKKKKKSHSTSERTRVGSEVRQSEKKDKGKSRDDREDSNEIIVKTVAPGEGRKMTESERKFEEVQRLRVSYLPNIPYSAETVERRESKEDGYSES